jgi:hypothetical protein
LFVEEFETWQSLQDDALMPSFLSDSLAATMRLEFTASSHQDDVGRATFRIEECSAFCNA